MPPSVNGSPYWLYTSTSPILEAVFGTVGLPNVQQYLDDGPYDPLNGLHPLYWNPTLSEPSLSTNSSGIVHRSPTYCNDGRSDGDDRTEILEIVSGTTETLLWIVRGSRHNDKHP